MDKIHINAVAYKSGDIWIVQGIEYDIATRAVSREDVPNAFIQAVCRNLAFNEKRGRAALDGIAAAPSKFRAMFDRARETTQAKNGDIRFLEAA